MSNKSKKVDNFINYLKSIFTIIKSNQNDNINFHVIPKIPKIRVLNFMDIDKLRRTSKFYTNLSLKRNFLWKIVEIALYFGI